MQNNCIKDLLNFKEVEVKKIKNLKDSVEVYVELPKTTQFCPKCAFETSKVHDYYTQPIKDIPIQFKPTTIFYRKRRYECCVCGKRFYEKNELVGKFSRKTTRFVAYVTEQLRDLTSMSDIANKCDTSPNFISRHCNLKTDDDFDELSYILTNYSENLRIAYREKECLLDILHSEDSFEIKSKNFNDWVMRNLESDIPQLKSCAETYQHWYREIVNSLAVPYSNGPTEGFNNKIKVLKRVSFGMRNFTNFKARIMLLNRG